MFYLESSILANNKINEKKENNVCIAKVAFSTCFVKTFRCFLAAINYCIAESRQPLCKARRQAAGPRRALIAAHSSCPLPIRTTSARLHSAQTSPKGYSHQAEGGLLQALYVRVLFKATCSDGFFSSLNFIQISISYYLLG